MPYQLGEEGKMTLQIFKERIFYCNRARSLCQVVLFLWHTKQKTQTF